MTYLSRFNVLEAEGVTYGGNLFKISRQIGQCKIVTLKRRVEDREQIIPAFKDVDLSFQFWLTKLSLSSSRYLRFRILINCLLAVKC